MKILFCTTMDLQIQTFHWRTIKALHDMGHTVDAVTNGTYTTDGISHKYTVPFNRNPLHPDNFKALSMLKTILRENQYDIISCHSPVTGFYGRLAAKEMKIKVLYTAHGFHFWNGAPLVNQLAYKNMERLAAHWTDVLMTINPEDYAAAQKFHYKLAGGPVYIPGVGVDVKAIQAAREDKALIRNELGLPEDAFVLYSIGELIPRKNHKFVIDTLAEEFRNDPSLHYCVAGNGKLTEELTAHIKELGLENQIHLLGFRKDARRLMYGMDVFVFPSYQEGLPVAVMEAMAAGLPIIATDIRGNHDLIHHEQNGLLYPCDDQEAFLKCFRLLREDGGMRAAFGRQVQDDIMVCSLEVIEPQILDLYRI
ncbi:MAG: glycosyltransferase family 4 protein [Solobacterium sp.]|nr:glycosyltransferase family 4 protein [Solobacterium sp.]